MYKKNKKGENKMSKKNDFDKAMDKAIDGASKLAASIGKNDVCKLSLIHI